MRYLLRLVVYLSLFFVTYSVCSVLLLRAVPVTVTPLKVLRFFENFTQDGFSVHSNWVPFDRINPSVVQAVIATEDNPFATHNGFDWEAINQALDENREGKRLRGGSTISQQTAKNVFCFPSRTWLRKGSRGLLHRADRVLLEQTPYHGNLPECHRDRPEHVRG